MRRLKSHSMMYVLALVLVVAAGCESPPDSVTEAEPAAEPVAAVSASRVWVARPDGSKSCEAESGRSLRDDEGILKDAGVTVFEARKGDDGMMHMQVCGAETGKQNRYLISSESLDAARKLGFEPVTE